MCFFLNCLFFFCLHTELNWGPKQHWTPLMDKTVEKFFIHSLKSYRFGKNLRSIKAQTNRLKNSFYPSVIQELNIVGIHKYIKLRNAQIWWGYVLLLCICSHFILLKSVYIPLHLPLHSVQYYVYCATFLCNICPLTGAFRMQTMQHVQLFYVPTVQ